MNRHGIRLTFLLFGLIMSSFVFAGESGQTVTSVDLKVEPFSDANTLSNLAAKTVVDVLKRQGGWLQVKTVDGASGWVKMTGIKLDGAGTSKSGDSGLANAINMAQTGRSGNTGITVATGVRGLTPDDLKNAKPNPGEVTRLDSFTVTKAEAESFARSANVSRHSVDYLAEGKSSSTPASGPATSIKNFFGGAAK